MKFKQFLSERYEDDDSHLTPGDRWLKKYTYENLDKWPSADALKELLDDYPYEGGTVYRGLNFRDKAQWDKFLEETDNCTKLETGSISSWATTAGEAKAFALTRPTYFLNKELMQAEHHKNMMKDYMIGHVGLILKATVSEGAGIDVRKSKYGKESEVILKPGTYTIEVHKKMIPFEQGINRDNYKTEFMSIKSIQGSREDGADELDPHKFEHIMFLYKDGFDDEMSSHLFKLLTGTLRDIKYEFKVKNGDDFDELSSNWGKNPADRLRVLEIYAFWNVPAEFFFYYELLQESDRAKIDSKLEGVFKAMDADFDRELKDADLVNQKFRVTVDHSIQLALKLDQYKGKLKFMQKINNAVGARYNALNSIDKVREINKMEPEQQKKAIEKMTRDIVQTLMQLNKSGHDR